MTTPQADTDLDLQLNAYQRRASRRKGRKSAAEILGYTAAAGGLAFAGGDAMASIVHFNTQVSTSWNTITATTYVNVLGWDINNNGQADGALFAGAVGSALFGGVAHQGYFGAGTGQAYFLASTASNIIAKSLVQSSSVGYPGASSTFNAFGYFANKTIISGATLGNFYNTTGYIGFAFGDATNSGPIFGWARVRADISTIGGFQAKVTVFEWAYDDSGAPIHVADRSSVPEPSTSLLALLGMGALGVQGFRRRRDAGLKRLAEAQEAQVEA